MEMNKKKRSDSLLMVTQGEGWCWGWDLSHQEKSVPQCAETLRCYASSHVKTHLGFANEHLNDSEEAWLQRLCGQMKPKLSSLASTPSLSSMVWKHDYFGTVFFRKGARRLNSSEGPTNGAMHSKVLDENQLA